MAARNTTDQRQRCSIIALGSLRDTITECECVGGRVRILHFVSPSALADFRLVSEKSAVKWR